MSTTMTYDRGSIATLADRVVSDGADRPVSDLLAALRAEQTVATAELRVEHVGDAGGGDAFFDADRNSLKAYGYSTRFPMTRAAIQFSGFADDEPVDVYARDDAILLVSTRDDGGPRLREVVAVELEVANVPDAVVAVLAEHDARMCPETVMVTADGTLAFSVVAPTEFEHVTDHSLRTFGNGQISLTVPKAALERSGLDAGDSVSVRACTGAVVFSKQ